MPNFWNMRNVVNSAGETEGEILLYGDIGDSYWSSIQSKEFVEGLKALGDVKQLNIRINSPGGEVTAAQAIVSTLKRHPANKTGYIDGLAASAATFIPMVCNKVIMPENALFMVHNPWTMAYGDANDFEEMKDFLNKIRDTMIPLYEAKTGLSREKIIELMDAETWMTAQEALDYGFIDEIEGAVQVAASVKNEIMTLNGVSVNLSKYLNSAKLNNFVPENTEIIENMIENTVISEPKLPENNSINDMDEQILCEKYPKILSQIKESAKNEGIQQERERIRAIDDLGIIGHTELLNKAKFETHITAEQTALEVIKAEKQFKSNYINNIQQDSTVLNEVKPTDTSKVNNNDKEGLVDAFVRGFNKNKK